MSTVFSRKMQSVGTKLLSKFGSTVTLIRVGAKVWDPVLAEIVRGPDTEIPLGAAVPVPVSGGLAGTRPQHFRDGTAIEAGDMQLICDSSVSPRVVDRVRFNGNEWSIVAVSPPVVNDDVIVNFILVRR